MSALDGIPHGWTFVPLEATDPMCHAGVEAIERAMNGDGAPFKFPDIEHLYDIFAAMLRAAPKPSEDEIQVYTQKINVDEHLYRAFEMVTNLSGHCQRILGENFELQARVKELEEKISRDHSDRMWEIHKDRQGGC